DPARCRRRDVVRATEPRDRVEQHDDVLTELDESLGALDRELGDGRVVVGGAVEGRGDDLTLDRALHVRDLFGALVDEHDHEVDLRVVGGDRVGDRLQHERLARLGRRDDEAALSLADRGDEVDDARRHDGRLGLEAQPLLRVQRRELAELGPLARLVGAHAVDGVEAHERVELRVPALAGVLAVARLAHRAGDGVTLAQPGLLDLVHRDVHVVVTGQVAARAHEGVVVLDVEDAADGQQDVVLADLDFVVATELAASPARATAALAVAVAVTATVTTSAAALVVVVATVLAAVVL